MCPKLGIIAELASIGELARGNSVSNILDRHKAVFEQEGLLNTGYMYEVRVEEGAVPVSVPTRRVTEPSQLLLTFATPCGRFCYKRLPMGISSAPEVYQKPMSDLHSGTEGAVVYFDDFLIAAPNLEAHNIILDQSPTTPRGMWAKFKCQ